MSNMCVRVPAREPKGLQQSLAEEMEVAMAGDVGSDPSEGALDATRGFWDFWPVFQFSWPVFQFSFRRPLNSLSRFSL